MGHVTQVKNTTLKNVHGMEATVKSSMKTIPTAQYLFQTGLEMESATEVNTTLENVDGTG